MCILSAHIKYFSFGSLGLNLVFWWFTFAIGNCLNEKKPITDTANGLEYVPTYEDKDGDWMLVGDVPWK